MTNSDENKELLRDEEVTNKGAKSEDYATLLSKIRKQVDIEGESTLTRKYHEESNTDSVEINEESEKPQENDYEETVVLDRNELKQALIKQEVKDEILPEKKEDKKKPVLEVLGLKKRIGLKTIVEDISFDMHEGEIIGLLGPNGSGKTTIMRMLVGLTKTTKGEVYCFEKPLGLGKVKMLKEVGAMIETPEFYNYMSGWSNLKQMARVCGKKVSRARMKELVEFVGLSKVIRKKVKTYSLGMRQRLGLAQALLNDPKILILDEPVNGLDPQGVQDFRNKLKEIASTGVSILISSHLLDEIEKVSDRVIVIEKGRIIADDKLDRLVADETIKTLISTYDVEKAEVLIRELGIRYELTKEGFIFENISREDKARVITYLVTNNVELDSVRELTTSLEDRFLQITGGENK
ncbi:MAG: ABC transporter ATP-binding protein [Gemella morbillorum]|uniref:ATP-binding cassette domain-containing protein n=1 Tax=Gemella morbillorum TaxID=29391 RepID=A0AAP9KSH0_9BACL|nr:ABC transporter ATP-binding protein [Gemella morbillorum]EFV35147.1 ABC transporter [Gemella morbillorum M424]MBF1209617.1 ABC transporter ATP-binding protein [Gemella morbillorum]QGS08441.1 ATP-binding cassette domain-containing protein [Gemella morbillorum]